MNNPKLILVILSVLLPPMESSQGLDVKEFHKCLGECGDKRDTIQYECGREANSKLEGGYFYLEFQNECWRECNKFEKTEMKHCEEIGAKGTEKAEEIGAKGTDKPKENEESQ